MGLRISSFVPRTDKAPRVGCLVPPSSDTSGRPTGIFLAPPVSRLGELSQPQGIRVARSWSLSLMCQTLGDTFKARQPAIEQQISNIFGLFGRIHTRVKSEASIAGKLAKYLVLQTKTRFAHVGLLDDRQAISIIMEDGVGARVVLSDLSPSGIDRLVEEILEAIMSGNLKVLRVRNYRGEGVAPYLTDKNIEDILVAADLANIQIRMENGESAVRKSGFTAFGMICEIGGVLVDLQFMGPKVHEINAADHVRYKYLEQKLDDVYYNSVIGGFTAVLKTLSADLQAIYKTYLRDCFLWARRIEMGLETPKPEVPAELSALHAYFDVDRLRTVLEMAKQA